MFGNIGLPEILIIILVVVLLFGAKKIPELARGLGQGLKEFKKASKDEERETDKNAAAGQTDTNTKDDRKA
jgi:sec-independent protein translocase protein TatA